MDFEVVVIGSGQAGIPLAVRLARGGKQVLLAERGALGGTCVNTGCTPTKTLVASARAAHVARSAGRLGVHAEAVRVDFPAVIARKDAIVRSWHEGIDRRLASAGARLRLVRGHARLTGGHGVEVAGEQHTGQVVVLNVGARPVEPPIRGLGEVPWLDNHRVMELRALPSHLVVVGGGYVGCEFAQLYRRLGAAVTLIEPGPHLLGREDVEVSQALEGVFREEGITVVFGARVEEVSGGAERVSVRLSGGRSVEGSHLLVATGRRPNTADLGCEAAGVALDARGFVQVDDHYATSAAGVYAVGDCVGGPQFTHSAWDDHRLLFEILAGRRERGRKDRLVPHTAYTDPQVAGVGLTEREAKARGVPYEAASTPFESVARALETDERAGLLKVLIDPASERILGASIVGAEAGELIHVFAALMQARAPARALVDMEAVHPSFAEGVQAVVMALPRYALS
ncbi:mercuric reductase [Aggregicoccus sp. 17bor-14]|uniref:dihydrolipoyl dehydrogenase family protein n=1 Tax=Myxococcaceae TaxID=31 RepID=UPI00129CAB4F|nr:MULTISPECIES: FAD-dependent oxidoreductase [Myxococcaceae]MBF5043772.1 FAD-dependent oxidoreductase [Simulacricoccus sp. 17bor-14]MRI89526.1 mercuric reductase [Aggregicoccus sp. 17bor-14]